MVGDHGGMCEARLVEERHEERASSGVPGSICGLGDPRVVSTAVHDTWDAVLLWQVDANMEERDEQVF